MHIYREGKCERQIFFFHQENTTLESDAHIPEYSFQKQCIISLRTRIDFSSYANSKICTPFRNRAFLYLSEYVRTYDAGGEKKSRVNPIRRTKNWEKRIYFGILSAINFSKEKNYLKLCAYTYCGVHTVSVFFWQCDITVQYFPLFEKSLSQLYKSRCCLEPAYKHGIPLN